MEFSSNKLAESATWPDFYLAFGLFKLKINFKVPRVVTLKIVSLLQEKLFLKEQLYSRERINL